MNPMFGVSEEGYYYASDDGAEQDDHKRLLERGFRIVPLFIPPNGKSPFEGGKAGKDYFKTVLDAFRWSLEAQTAPTKLSSANAASSSSSSSSSSLTLPPPPPPITLAARVIATTLPSQDSCALPRPVSKSVIHVGYPINSANLRNPDIYGWTYKRGKGLQGWLFIRPGGKSPSEGGVEASDWFDGEEAAIEWAKKHGVGDMIGDTGFVKTGHMEEDVHPDNRGHALLGGVGGPPARRISSGSGTSSCADNDSSNENPPPPSKRGREGEEEAYNSSMSHSKELTKTPSSSQKKAKLLNEPIDLRYYMSSFIFGLWVI